MMTYFFVYTGIGAAGAASVAIPSSSGFALLNYLAGMLPWLAFSEAAWALAYGATGASQFPGKKLVLPAVETLPVNLVASGLVSEFFAVILFCGFLLIARHRVPLTVLWLPVLLVPQTCCSRPV